MSETLLQTTDALPVTQHPRFIEGNDENVETLTKFTQGLQELQVQNSEIVGAALFGSRLKGEATAGSDVDCTILVDAEQLAVHGVDIDVDQQGWITWGKHEDLKQDFGNHFGEVLAEKTAKDPTTIKQGIYVQPISQKLIEKQVGVHVEYLKKYDEYREKSEAWINDLNADPDQRPEPPDYVPLSGGIPALFSPQLISGSEKYQHAVINELSRQRDYGEAAFKEIMSHVQFGEGHLESSDPKYPANLEEARALYGEKNAAG
jgi:predicted nucleotidyltransferase